MHWSMVRRKSAQRIHQLDEREKCSGTNSSSSNWVNWTTTRFTMTQSHRYVSLSRSNWKYMEEGVIKEKDKEECGVWQEYKRQCEGEAGAFSLIRTKGFYNAYLGELTNLIREAEREIMCTSLISHRFRNLSSSYISRQTFIPPLLLVLSTNFVSFPSLCRNFLRKLIARYVSPIYLHFAQHCHRQSRQFQSINTRFLVIL